MATARNRSHFLTRTRVILGVLFFIAVLLLIRLYFLQIVHGTEYRAKATGQYISTSGSFYDRGNIFFKDKDNREISAATIKSGYILALDPRLITDVEAVVALVTPYSTLDEATIRARAEKAHDPYEEIAVNVNEEIASAVRAAKLAGVLLIPERWRYYPGGSLAAQTLGFVAYDHDVQNGRYGLERYYEDVLTRRESNLYVNFFAELFTNVRDVVFVPVHKREGSIVITIEPSVQAYLETILAQTQEKWNSEFTAGIIIDPQTGAVLAMGMAPSFDLNEFGNASTWQYANPLVERVYEMGSIMKPLTVAAGLDEGAITVNSTYNDAGSMVLDGRKISNFDGRARGTVPMQEILSQSLNTGVAHIVAQMGKDAFRRYMYSYGINEETGIDLPNEARNLTENLTSPRDIEYATASFGQGVAVTPINMARMLSVLPDGFVEQPHVVGAIHAQSGLTHTFDYSDVREQVLKPETAEVITRMLVTVFDEALLGGEVKMEHYSIAAKTGTAQIASPDGAYYDDRYLHSFFGYFPAYDAKYPIFLMNVEPKEVQYASQTLTYPFVDLAQFLINYYNIPPDR